MRKQVLVGAVAALVASMALAVPPRAVSAQMGGGGGGGIGDIYSDLWVVLRDVDGVPILTPAPGDDPFYEEGPVEVRCIQPISSTVLDGATQVTNPVDGRTVWLIPLVGEGSTALSPAEADTACDPQPAFASAASEVELERLNLVRTSDEVLWKKLVDIRTRLQAAAEITLDGAGRITTDGVAIDASPEHAAMYAAAAPAVAALEGGPAATEQLGGLMDTGSIPGLAGYPGVPASIPQAGSAFDEWMLAAASVGAAAGKSVPITIDTIEYYNRVAAPDGDVAEWGHAEVIPGKDANGEQFIDYTDFSYTRADVFNGCSIWLDVPTLTWKYGPILDRVEFLDIVEFPTPGHTVANVAGFAQMADDVRSVINYLHENDVVVNPDTGLGFYIDPVFQNTCTTPNPDLGGLSQAQLVVELNQPVDAVDPTVTITAAPNAQTTATTASFAFTAADASRVLCVLDDGAIVDCLSPATYTGLQPGTHTFKVIAMGVAGNFVSDDHTWTIIPAGEDTMVTSLAPVRFADTRPGWVAADGLFFGTGPVPAGGTVQVPVAGRGGVPVGAKAVVANVTLVGAAGAGYATVFPCGSVPATSSVNYLGVANEAVANEVIVKLSPAGSICVFTSAAANVLVDVAGYVPASSDFVSLTPVRLADTRPTPVAAGQFVEVPVAGRGGVPVGAKAVVANVTLVGAAGAGYATVFPCGSVPATSSVNYLGVANEAVANEVIVKLSPAGSICVFTSAAANVLVDVAGYVPASSDFVSLTPVRLADTRPTPVAAGQFVEVPVAGRGGVPVGAKAVVANVTLVGAAGAGYATVFPCGSVPATSSVNYLGVANEAVANEVIVKLSPAGSICVFTSAAANVLVDVAGYL